MIPSWILEIFAAIMLMVAAISASRLVAARPWLRPDPDADIDGAHVLMGVAMAGMLASGLKTLPSAVWVAVFAVVTAWFAWRVSREARATKSLASVLTKHHVPHLIHGAAMIYMFAALSSAAAAGGSAMGGMGSMGGVGGMGTLRVPTAGLVFVLLMAGWAVWDLDQVSKSGSSGLAREFAIPAGLRHRIAVAAAGTGPVLATSGPAGGGVAAITSAEATTTPAESGETAPAAVAGASAMAARGVLHPGVATGCRIAMGVTMALMLVLMI